MQLFKDQPLYRLLPPAYRALWLKWSQEQQAPEQQEAAANGTVQEAAAANAAKEPARRCDRRISSRFRPRCKSGPTPTPQLSERQRWHRSVRWAQKCRA